MNSASYLTPLARPESARAELICFHHAGGSAQFYDGFQEHLASDLAVTAVELPGRGRRFGESIPEQLEQVVGEIVDECRAESWGQFGPVVLFGHSLGAYLAYEVARRLQASDDPVSHVVVSGTTVPGDNSLEEEYHTMGDDELREKLREMGGTPPKVLEEPELMELFLPIIRADFRLVETYTPKDVTPLNCPVTAIGGEDDERLSQTDLQQWRTLTEAAFAWQTFPGGHFYLKHHCAEVLEWLGDHLESVGAFDRG